MVKDYGVDYSNDRECKTSKKYFYNITFNECQLFNYKGCSGNLNRFDNLHKCLESCGDYNKTKSGFKPGGRSTSKILSSDEILWKVTTIQQQQSVCFDWKVKKQSF